MLDLVTGFMHDHESREKIDEYIASFAQVVDSQFTPFKGWANLLYFCNKQESCRNLMGRCQDQMQALPTVVDMCLASTPIAEK